MIHFKYIMNRTCKKKYSNTRIKQTNNVILIKICNNVTLYNNYFLYICIYHIYLCNYHLHY